MIAAPRHADGPLILADIGGYTSFLRTVQVVHADDAFAGGRIPDAYGFVSSLLDGIVTRLVPPFTLAKLEGDAVFAYTEDAARAQVRQTVVHELAHHFGISDDRLHELGAY